MRVQLVVIQLHLIYAYTKAPTHMFLQNAILHTFLSGPFANKNTDASLILTHTPHPLQHLVPARRRPHQRHGEKRHGAREGQEEPQRQQCPSLAAHNINHPPPNLRQCPPLISTSKHRSCTTSNLIAIRLAAQTSIRRRRAESVLHSNLCLSLACSCTAVPQTQRQVDSGGWARRERDSRRCSSRFLQLRCWETACK